MINVDMVQGLIREVNQNFGRASHGERLGESLPFCDQILQFMKLIL